MVATTSVNLSCPTCGEMFVAIVSEDTTTAEVSCPECANDFAVVQAVSTDSAVDETSNTSELTATVLGWRWADSRDPYSGSDSDIPVEQRVKADVRVNDSTYAFDLYYTPDYHYFDHVVRGQLETGQKSKNAFKDESGELYFKDRGVPWNGDKQWTYLNEDECRERSEIAELGPVEPDDDSGNSNRFRVYLGEQARPLVDEELDTELVETLVKGLVVFQTKF